MNDKNTENMQKQEKNNLVKPNEMGSICFSSSIKIFDPNSNQILVQKRGDN